MPVFRLEKEYIFPPVELSEPDGLLAVGGDLSAGRLIAAYSGGIFPWFSRSRPIMWWSPDPRFVILPGGLKVSRSMRQVLDRGQFTITFDTCFREVITSCSRAKRRDNGTWITKEMIEAYVRLHTEGYAHSVEAWEHGELAGGLYGVCLGRAFFGESMFSSVSNASKAAPSSGTAPSRAWMWTSRTSSNSCAPTWRSRRRKKNAPPHPPRRNRPQRNPQPNPPRKLKR